MSKNIVICCDGTGNIFCKKKTNVAKLFTLLENNPEKQMIYYDLGVGTLGSYLSKTKIGEKVSRLLGLAIAYGITDNIEEAYLFLMKNYSEGDKIFLFGFSRGAYTVRALGGMLGKCGLLHPWHENLVSYAAKFYYNKEMGQDEIDDFKAAFSIDVLPHFIGVWDTVKSVGIKDQAKFGDNILHKNIPYGYHALAIDERRKKFKPILWADQGENQTIVQTWFAGVHSDIGGSYDEAGLSNITLHWMINNAGDRDLLLNESEILEREEELKPDIKTKVHKSLKLLWRVFGWGKRKIPENANIHNTVYEKIDLDNGYNPKNVPKRK